jgi:hypothetical protein
MGANGDAPDWRGSAVVSSGTDHNNETRYAPDTPSGQEWFILGRAKWSDAWFEQLAGLSLQRERPK